MKEDNGFIAAIELGSSKIVGMVGRKIADDTLEILAVSEEPSDTFMRYGMVNNLEKAIQSITNVKQSLEQKVQTKIAQMYVGVSGKSMHSVKNTIKREALEGCISSTLVDEMCDANRPLLENDSLCLMNIIPQEYKIDTQIVTEPIGFIGNNIEARYVAIVAHPALQKNLSRSLEGAKVQDDDCVIAPTTLADQILTEAEKRSGCVLIDFGAETTTILVYYKNILRHLTVLPLGSHNVTKDIMSLQIEEDEAESLKLTHGSAYSNFVNEGDNVVDEIVLKDGRRILSNKFMQIVEARIQEIIFNIVEQIRLSGYNKEQLLGGIILTGGGSNFKDLIPALQTYTGFEKIRIGTKTLFTVTGKIEDDLLKSNRYNTILSLVYTGSKNCSGGKLVTKTLFEEEEIEEKEENTANKVISGRIGGGIVEDEVKPQEVVKEAVKKEIDKTPKASKFKNLFGKIKEALALTVIEDPKEGDE